MYDEVSICGMVNTVKPDLKSRQEVETWHVRPFPELRLAHKSLIQTDTDREDSLFFTFFLPPSLHFSFFYLSVYALVYGGNSHREENIIVPPFSAPISARYRVNQIGWAESLFSFYLQSTGLPLAF